MSKQKLLVSIFGAIAALLLVVAGVAIFAINYNLASAPTVSILDDGKNIMAFTQMSTDYKGYRFRFQAGGKEFLIDSENNILNLNDQESIIPGTTYDVSVCYLGEIEGSNSKYSEKVSWTAYTYLKSPYISHNSSEGKIQWTAVEHATNYVVYYGQNGQSIETEQPEIKLQDLGGGKFDIFVVAQSSFEGYKKSKPSNTLKEIEVYHKLQGFNNVIFNKDQMTVTAKSAEKFDKFLVYIDEKLYEVVEFSCKQVSSADSLASEYEYTFNLSAIYKDGAKIGVAPFVHGYNVFEGDIAYFNP